MWAITQRHFRGLRPFDSKRRGLSSHLTIINITISGGNISQNKKDTTSMIGIILTWYVFLISLYFLYITYTFFPLQFKIIIICCSIVSFWMGVDLILFKYERINHWSIVILFRYIRYKLHNRKSPPIL